MSSPTNSRPFMSWAFLALFGVFGFLTIIALEQRQWIAAIGAAVLAYWTFRDFLAAKDEPPIEHLPGGSPPWPEAPIPPTPPQVVVNVPKDYKPLETLEGRETTLVGEKALLWWTVYKHALYNSAEDEDGAHITKAVWAADQAVDKVYGVEP